MAAGTRQQQQHWGILCTKCVDFHRDTFLLFFLPANGRDVLLRAEQSCKLDEANFQPRKKPLLSGPSAKIIRPAVTSVKKFRAIPHNSKYRYGERGAADAKPKAQIILDAAKVSAASGGCSEPKQGQRSQSARGFCPRSTMRVPQPDIIEHFGNADAVPQPPERCLSR